MARENELRALRAIIDTTLANNGKAPTMAELAETLGYTYRARGNVQRMLSRLKPQYVDWSTSPRSLRVTTEGYRLLGEPESSNSAAEDTRSDYGGYSLMEYGPVKDTVLILLASGLLHMHKSITSEPPRPVQAPYSEWWRRGLNILATEYLKRGIDGLPASTQKALQLCHKPIGEWGLPFSVPAQMLNESLLAWGEPTILCRELAYEKGNPEMEEQQKYMLVVMEDARTASRVGAYVAVREYLVRNATSYQKQRLSDIEDVKFAGLGEHMKDMYQSVPARCVEKGVVSLCGYCGWTLERLENGLLACGDQRCAAYTKNFTVGTKQLAYRPDLQRVRPGIRRYVVIPGIYELRLHDKLTAMGLECELWPRFDRYDLRITFPDGEVWAVDVKDWVHAHLLAPTLSELYSGPGAEWDRAFFGVPAERVAQASDYLTMLRTRSTLRKTSIVTVESIIEEAKDKLVALGKTVSGRGQGRGRAERSGNNNVKTESFGRTTPKEASNA